MQPDEIKPGRTYEGADGRRMVVCAVKRRRWPSGRTSRQVWFFPTPGWRYNKPLRQKLEAFAESMVRVVNVDDAP